MWGPGSSASHRSFVTRIGIVGPESRLMKLLDHRGRPYRGAPGDSAVDGGVVAVLRSGDTQVGAEHRPKHHLAGRTTTGRGISHDVGENAGKSAGAGILRDAGHLIGDGRALEREPA